MSKKKFTKKSIFSKTKPHIKNRYDKKLDMVPYFTPRALVDHTSKTERQVENEISLKKAYFAPYAEKGG